MLIPVIAAAWLTGCAPGVPQYTILLSEVTHPTHHAQIAKNMMRKTEEDAGWQDMFIIHEAGVSRLYRGKYATLNQAERPLDKARRFTVEDHIIYPGATIVPLPGEKVGPPELDAANATGLYTVVVARFYDVPEAGYTGRRRLAVDYCQQLRDEGREAYYHHYASYSLVMVGSFPESSYQMKLEPSGVARYTVTDPTLRDTLKDFPHLAVNGRMEYDITRDPRTGAKQKNPVTSYINELPNR
jgi:hypothetical protein